LDELIAVEAARTQHKMKKVIDGWELADSIVYSTGAIKKADLQLVMSILKN
jgi:hypothetical protein